jgi:hypothetical protein
MVMCTFLQLSHYGTCVCCMKHEMNWYFPEG